MFVQWEKRERCRPRTLVGIVSSCGVAGRILRTLGAVADELLKKHVVRVVGRNEIGWLVKFLC